MSGKLYQGKKGKKVGEAYSSTSVPTGPQAINRAAALQINTTSGPATVGPQALIQQASFPLLATATVIARPPASTAVVVQQSLGKASQRFSQLQRTPVPMKQFATVMVRDWYN